MFRVLIFTVLFTATVVNAFWTACGGSATTHEVTSNVCSGDRCNVVRGQTMIANTTISFAEPHHQLTVRVRTVLLGITITLPLTPEAEDACRGIFIQGSVFHGCPVTVGTRFNWVMETQIPQNIPAFQNNIVYTELLDHNDEIVSCSRLLATVV
ncbi:hypothetical protein PVAND_003431 [Polypedilum vanderplanki]|uniref:MD-2-related lipid-recognition domain-containing protein n=1 Tax=Polypedilum vanderplanki TaxID=319348 RepID=A0A9J6BU05_POLVA|nr:hypothetical protein PVAND_003431 [Polypedilum vanderplanki]